MITEPFVLAADVELIAVSELDEDLRQRLDAASGDVALSRRRSRVLAKLVDARVAHLLKEFRTPRRIVDAVIVTSEALGLERTALLREAYPLLTDLIDDGYLLHANEKQDALGSTGAFESGSVVLGLRIVSCIRALEDVELYQARAADGKYVALKITRRGSDVGTEAVRNESAILRYLNGVWAPRLLDAGTFEERPYVIMEWRSGIGVDIAAAEWRFNSTPGCIHAQLARLCVSIADLYANLHGVGVIHADVHPHNLLVDADGSITLLDFGASRQNSAALTLDDRNPRLAVGFYLEPEAAGAERRGASWPPATMQGEQYAVAAMLYELLTGVHYLDFKLTRSEALRQIAEELPVSLVARGLEQSAELERVLFSALAKRPGERFSSMSVFASAMNAALKGMPNVRVNQSPRRSQTSASMPRIDEVMRRIRAGFVQSPRTLDAAPYCSVNDGGAGIAYVLYRLAQLDNDPMLLSLADVWCRWASVRANRRAAFTRIEGDETSSALGHGSLFHGAPGLHLVQTLIAHAMDDRAGANRGVRAFTRLAVRPSHQDDLTLGRAGLLLGCALLIDTLSAGRQFSGRRALRTLGTRLAQRTVDELSVLPPLAVENRIRNLGMAHGWGGLLYSLLVWYAVARNPVPAPVAERLRELAALAEPTGRGVRWPWRERPLGSDEPATYDSDQYMPGWCNGSAGFVLIWSAAHQLLPTERFDDLALGAAWNAWEEDMDDVFDLCCGAAGRAYALLAAYRLTGDKAWLDRSVQLQAAGAVALERSTTMDTSLYRGALGVGLLSRELEQPHFARMPIAETQGWLR